MADLRLLLTLAAPYRRLFVLSGALMLLGSAAALAVPWLGGRLAETFLPGGTLPTPGVPAVLGALLILALVGTWLVRRRALPASPTPPG